MIKNNNKFTTMMVHPVNAFITDGTMMTSLGLDNLTMFTNILELMIVFDVFNLIIVLLMKVFSVAWISHNGHTKIIYNVEENPER